MSSKAFERSFSSRPEPEADWFCQSSALLVTRVFGVQLEKVSFVWRGADGSPEEAELQPVMDWQAVVEELPLFQ